MANIAAISTKQHGRENNKKLNLEMLVPPVGANIQTTIHVIICLQVKKRWKIRKKTTDLLQTHFCQKCLDDWVSPKITRSNKN